MAQEAKLRPGDRIRIVCDEEASLCVDRTIPDTGVVRLPIVGGMTLAGATPTEAAASIRSAMRKRSPDFSGAIKVLLVPSADAPVTFTGAVKLGGEAPFHTGMRLSDVVKLAEPTFIAELEAVVITTATGEILTVDATDSNSDPELRSGDKVYFPVSTRPREVIVVGGVVNPGSIPYNKGIDVAQALAAVGGVTAHGIGSGIRLLREGKEVAVLNAATDGARLLERGDVLQVPLIENRQYVTVVGRVKRPGLVEFRPGMTLTQVIEAAGGLGEDAAADIVEVRTVVAPGYGVKRYDLAKISAGAVKDVVLKSSQVVAVPPTSYRAALKGPVQKEPKRVVPPSEAQPW